VKHFYIDAVGSATSLHGVTTQNVTALIFIAVKTPYLAFIVGDYYINQVPNWI